jgi:hypothetical protein
LIVSDSLDVHFPPQPARWVLHAPADWWGEHYAAAVHVEIRDVGLSAEVSTTLWVPSAGGEWDLAAFVQDLADDWHGWRGERTWRSKDGELCLDATHDGRGHVTLGVTLRQTPYGEGWTARVALEVEAGEQLSGLAQDLRAHLVI